MDKILCAISVQIVERPARKIIIKRGKTARNYFEFCKEVGCDIWDILHGIPDALYEPIGMWLPDNLRPSGTSYYAQGVEVALDWRGKVPEGFTVIELPPCKMLVFQGPPYDDEKFMQAIDDFYRQIKNYSPEISGYKWADNLAPKFQFEPMGYRGYIEGRPVIELTK